MLIYLVRTCLLEDGISKDRTKLLGNYNALSGAGFIVGPSLHGYLMQKYGANIGIKLSFALCGLIFCVNAVIVVVILMPKHKKHLNDKVYQRDKNGIHSTSKNTREKNKAIQIKEQNSHWHIHQAIFLSRFLMAFAVMLFRSTFVLWILHYFPDYTSQTLGYILSYNGFLGLVFGFLVGPLSTLPVYVKQEEKLQLHASVLIVVALFGLALFGDIAAILASMTLLALGTATARVCGISLTVKYCKNDEVFYFWELCVG